jgi:hypothetical protein
MRRGLGYQRRGDEETWISKERGWGRLGYRWKSSNPQGRKEKEDTPSC